MYFFDLYFIRRYQDRCFTQMMVAEIMVDLKPGSARRIKKIYNFRQSSYNLREAYCVVLRDTKKRPELWA